ncbi:MAG: hypothetical protein GY849_08850 [Deltaproteobacteria bacterium]|nr:hypothetical protein [Deltaproteobacteria bacterium]
MDNKEEKDKLTIGEQLYNLTQSDEWKIFKDRYEDVILRLADIRNIPFTMQDKSGNTTAISSEQRTYEMQVRERTLMYLQQIMESILGDIQEYKELLNGMTEDKKQDGFVMRFDK